MAKSKSGGTRALLRGRVGSDVYSVGKDGMGKRQQVVRSLAETVANPRTENQMFGRMIMSTVMQAVSALSPIIDHSFDGVAKGQPSISEFIRRNYALVKADALLNPASDNQFGLNKYQEKGWKGGLYQISNGKAVLSAAVSATNTNFAIDTEDFSLTVGGVREAMGVGADGYITAVWALGDGTAMYTRVKLETSLADSTAVTADNVNSIFTIEGNAAVTVAIASAKITFTPDGLSSPISRGAIASVKTSEGWEHSACTMRNGESPVYASNVALPTYPVGGEQFLNGGEI